MTCTIVLAPGARRELNKLPEVVATAIYEFLHVIAQNPHRLGRACINELEGYHSAHRGGYRVIYRIDDDQVLVYVVRIRPRSTAYH